jgi:hypothetical protein
MAGGGFGRMVVPFVVVLVFFFVIMLLLGSIIGDGLAVGIPVAVGATAGLVAVLYKKFRRMSEGTVVRFSEHGVELSDQLGFRVRLAWTDMTRLGEVDTRMASPRSIGHGAGARARVGVMKSLGLIGWGERVTPRRIPGWMRQSLAAQPVNPADGRPEVSIPLGGMDPNWPNGPMGQWVRSYRPDLLATQPPAGQQTPHPPTPPGYGESPQPLQQPRPLPRTSSPHSPQPPQSPPPPPHSPRSPGH